MNQTSTIDRRAEARRSPTMGIIAAASVASLVLGIVVYTMRKRSCKVADLVYSNSTPSTVVAQKHKENIVLTEQNDNQQINGHKGRKKDERKIPKVIKSAVEYCHLPKQYATYACDGVLKDETEQSYECDEIATQEMIDINFLAQYYVKLVTLDSQQDYESTQQLRERMWALATQAFDNFVDIEIAAAYTYSMSLERAAKTRKTIAQYLQRFYTLVSYRYENHNDTKAQFDATSLSESITVYANSPFIVLSVDLMFANFAYIASIEYKYDIRRTEKATADYITSALAHIAYIPCSQNILNLRSIHQKTTCLNKLAITNAACGVLFDYALRKGDSEHAVSLLETYVGHLLVLTHMCLANHVAALFCHIALRADSPSDTYIDTIIQRERLDNRTSFQHIIHLQKQTMHNKSSFNTGKINAIDKAATELSEKIVSVALALDNTGNDVSEAKQLYRRIQWLPKHDIQTMSHKLVTSTMLPDTTGAPKDILEATNKLEYRLHQLYIFAKNLRVKSLYDPEVVVQSADKVFRIHLNKYNEKDILALKEVFTNPAKERSDKNGTLLAALDMLDAEGRTRDIYYSTEKHRNQLAQMGDNTILQVLSTIVEQLKYIQN